MLYLLNSTGTHFFLSTTAATILLETTIRIRNIKPPDT